mmetsp:Transcript_28140/g.5133  ORF Transcript_28140/g.5133 Transcript_28140/m.5133 type:complete len:98 (-) Transcript_28140:109-402(-)
MIYDLKGSQHNRKRKFGDVYKDEDFKQNNEQISLTHTTRKQLITAIQSDIRILQKLDIMDYSLLLAIFNSNDNCTKYEYQCKESPTVKYAISIIDYT